MSDDWQDERAVGVGDSVGEREARDRNRLRLRLFAVATGVVLVAGLAFVFLRTPVYQSTARLLVEPPAASDPRTAEGEAAQSVALQRELLTAGPVLNATIAAVEARDPTFAALDASAAALARRLKAEPVNESRVLLLSVEGPDPETSTVILDSWIESYLAYLETRSSQANTGSSQELTRQLADLEKRVSDKRAELAAFREKNDIVSLEREENDVLARLKGLTDALNDASAEEVTARARRDSIRDAIARGEIVVLDADSRVVADLERRVSELRAEIRELELKFTPQYIELDPDAQVTVRQLHLAEQELADFRAQSQAAALAEAERAEKEAAQSVAELQREIQSYRVTASRFSSRFAEHDALMEDLSQLEARYREVQDRAVALDVDRASANARVSVLEGAVASDMPIRPLYARDAGLAVAGAFLAGLVAVLLFEFIFRPTSRAREFLPLPYPVPGGSVGGAEAEIAARDSVKAIADKSATDEDEDADENDNDKGEEPEKK